MENRTAPGPPPPADGRLDSWKEIASYLKRSVRGVQRWEAEEGMPVHRHLHEKRGTVYAFSSELDAWWKERGSMLAEQNGAAEAEPLAAETKESEPTELVTSLPRKSRGLAWLTAGLAAAVLAAGVVAWVSRNGSGPATETLQALPSQARDWVLVAGFENRTGEKLFDGTLDYALGRELSNSRYFNVVSRDRVGDALRLMRKPLDTRLDAPLAREVCLRDGEIRALLTGRVEKLGSKYLFSVELVEPKQATPLAGFSEESAGADGSLAAMRRISNRVRAALGETPTAESSGKAGLAKVTTSSLRALQLYSQADLLMSACCSGVNGSWAGAEELLRQAVAEDPNFASAWIHLAWAVRNQERPLAELQPYAETALRLAETTTERERYFIRGSYYDLTNQREKAIAAYEALLALSPDHPWATGNLLGLYDRWKDWDRMLEVEIRAADARPGEWGLNFHAAYNFIYWKRQPAKGQPYLRRARELITPEVTELRCEAAWLEALTFTERWAEGNLEEAARELDRFTAKVDSLAERPRDCLAVEGASGYLTLGRLGEAERVAKKISDPGKRANVLAQVSFIRGDRLGLVRHLRSQEAQERNQASRTRIVTPLLEARAGLVREARGWLPTLERSALRGAPGRREIVLGEIALAEGSIDEAILRFEEAARLRDKRFDWEGSLLGAESFAAALKRKGQTERAIEVLEQAQGEFRPFDTGGPYWGKNRLDLARLYRSVGRVEEARAIEADLLKRLAVADPDHPVLLDLKRLQKS